MRRRGARKRAHRPEPDAGGQLKALLADVYLTYAGYPLQGGKSYYPTFSPDGRMCAYVRDNNIWIRKFDFDTEVQVTKDGELNKILNGITDWVYEEEFAVTNLMAWSPDSEYLAFVRFDESEVPEYSMQMYGEGLYPLNIICDHFFC